MKPVIKKISRRTQAHHFSTAIQITFAQVDIEAEEELAAYYNVTTAPSLLLFLNRTFAGRYDGEVKLEDVVNWVEHGGAPLVHVTKSDKDLNKMIQFRAKNSVLVVAKGTLQVRNMLVQTSAQVHLEGLSHQMQYVFLETGEEKFSVDLHRGANEKVQYEMIPDTEIFAEDFVAFVKRERQPWFGLITAENIDSLQSATDIVWACFAPDKFVSQVDKYAVVFRKSAAKWKKFRFHYVNTTAGPLPSKDPGCEEFPSVVVQHGDKRSSKTFELAELTEANVNKFLKSKPGDEEL